MHEIIAEIQRFKSTQSGPIVLALDGGSGAGKSTLAATIANEFDTALIQLDDFFSADIPDGQWDVFTIEERLNNVFDWRRLRKNVIEPLISGRRGIWYPFDFESGLRSDGTYGMKVEPVIREPAALILLEGAYSACSELADFVDLAILVEVPIEERHARLAVREDKEFLDRWHQLWDPVEDYYFNQVRPLDSFDLVMKDE